MIYFLIGEDLNKKREHVSKILGNTVPVFLEKEDVSENVLLEKSASNDLFGGALFYIVEDFFSKKLEFKKESIESLASSPNIFIFKDSKILASDVKKYSKYAEIIDFSLKEKKVKEKFNVFSICDAFGRRDKITAWILYNKAISSGLSSDEISGALFWKIKTMADLGSNVFTEEEIKNISNDLVVLYHDCHLGKKDFQIGLEQFILNSLNK